MLAMDVVGKFTCYADGMVALFSGESWIDAYKKDEVGVKIFITGLAAICYH